MEKFFMKKTTAEWVRKAEDDRVVAHEISQTKSRLHDVVCFHSQQCAEKYLSAVRSLLGIVI